MLKSSTLLRLAALLVLITCLGHTWGTFAPVLPEQVEVAKAVAVMETTVVPMPMGKAQSFADIFFGTNLSVSLLLLLCCALLLLLSRAPLSGNEKSILAVVSLGLTALAVISALYFFPLPAVCTGIAALLGFLVMIKKS